MKFNYCFLKKRFLLLLIALGIGSVLYANNELKLLTDSLRRVIDEKHVFVKEKGVPRRCVEATHQTGRL